MRPVLRSFIHGNDVLIVSRVFGTQEEEILKEALRTITIPGTTIFNMLIEKLFSLVPDEHLDYTYDSHAVLPPRQPLLSPFPLITVSSAYRRANYTALQSSSGVLDRVFLDIGTLPSPAPQPCSFL